MGDFTRDKQRVRFMLFDLDGTLCDSDDVHFEVFAEVFARDGGGETTRAYFQQHVAGRANDDIFTATRYPTLSESERARKASEKERAFREKLNERELTPTRGLVALLEKLDERDVKSCVVTNAPRANAEAMLVKLNLRARFPDEFLVIASECARAKPHPEPYLEGLRRLGATSSDTCVAFEDSPAGARAAVAANIPCVGILTSHSAETLRAVGCALCVEDFAAPELLRALGLAESK